MNVNLDNSRREQQSPLRHWRTKLSPLIENSMRTHMVLSLFDQVFLSAFSFTLNLILLRIWQPELFGMFAIVFAVSMIVYSVQNALIGAPLTTLRAQARDFDDERQLLASLWMANCALATAAFILTWAGVALALGDQYAMLPIAAALLVVGTLLREYIRTILFSEFCIVQVLVLDVVYVFAATAGLTMLWAWRGTFQLSQICFVLGFASIFASLPLILARLPLFSFQFGAASHTRYISIWKAHSRWALLGAVVTEVVNRAHVFVIGMWFGVAAVGILEAGRLIYRPLALILHAWARVAHPAFARSASVGDFAYSKLLARLSAAGLAVLTALFMIAVWLGWPFLQSQVFRGAYANIGFVVALWGFVSIISVAVYVYGTQLQGMARFRELSITSLMSSLGTLGALALVVAMGSYVWSIGAIAFGHIIQATLIFVLLSRLHQAGGANSWPRMEASG